MITETNVEVLKARFEKGLNYCNDLLKQIKAGTDSEVEPLFKKLDKGAMTLRELIDMEHIQNYSECPFSQCKYDPEGFVCFACPKDGGK